ncbi:MAG TPA: hypothetical protein VM098_02105 [Phycisphaerae bacterium]|nr:hypothetical protein [Phycisphaerae bacterium]
MNTKCAVASEARPSRAPSGTAWIWTGNDPDAHGQVAQFRLAFPATGAACWTGFADTLYTLFCNGRVVGVGPATGIHTMPRLTAWDLRPFLLPGQDNLLALEVWFEGRRNDCCDVDTLRGGVIGWLRHDGGVSSPRVAPGRRATPRATACPAPRAGDCSRPTA